MTQFEFLRELCEGSLRTQRLKAIAFAVNSKHINHQVREEKPQRSLRISNCGATTSRAFSRQEQIRAKLAGSAISTNPPFGALNETHY
jgi:hypothetical protein